MYENSLKHYGFTNEEMVYKALTTFDKNRILTFYDESKRFEFKKTSNKLLNFTITRWDILSSCSKNSKRVEKLILNSPEEVISTLLSRGFNIEEIEESCERFLELVYYDNDWEKLNLQLKNDLKSVNKFVKKYLDDLNLCYDNYKELRQAVDNLEELIEDFKSIDNEDK